MYGFAVYLTVFLRDQIDDHVVYDEVRYVRFEAKKTRIESEVLMNSPTMIFLQIDQK
jgi:hypothetical protein